jgi:transposase
MASLFYVEQLILQNFSEKIAAICAAHPVCQRLGTIPGIGPLTATALVAAVSDASHFKNGRQFAAWIGLVPRQHSTGGKPRLLGISKRGDVYLRTLLIHGARATLRWVGLKGCDRAIPNPNRLIESFAYKIKHLLKNNIWLYSPGSHASSLNAGL